MRSIRYSLAVLGMFLAMLCFCVATMKVLAPSLVGVWVGPQALFVIGIPSPDAKAMELMGESFAPVFYVAGYLLGGFSWNRMRSLKSTPRESLG